MNQTELIKKITSEVMKELDNKHSCSSSSFGSNTIPVGVSVRHIHISQQDLEIMFGKGYQLTKRNELTQPGEFAANEVVVLVGPRLRSITNVRILGPLRSRTQVELALTDAIILGLRPPVRKSGDLDGSESLTLVGPKGSLTLKEGVIRANRHIHMGPEDARRFGVKNDQIVSVEVDGDKALIFKNVQVRVCQGWKLEMHLDTDDANAAGINCGAEARLIKE
ncbi:MAG TPA: phosphate propanoyltransferase [Halanaerobiales bacterium]|nr:phosphate propanoyltransferase [Halanaerobiales bacterium]